MLDLKKQLLQRFQANKLAHFYILEGELDFNEWIDDFLQNIIQLEKKVSEKRAYENLKSGHADFLIIKKPST